jgi:FdhE protein
MDAVCESWLSTHPFLAPVARLHDAVQAAVDASLPEVLDPPEWSAWAEEARAGTPLLRSEAFGPLLRQRVAEVLADVAGRLDAAALPLSLHDPLRGVRDLLASGRSKRLEAAAWVLSHGGAESAPADPGLLRLLGWSTAARLLVRVHVALAPGGDAPVWSHGHCPTCGALPATAQLADAGGMRVRVLGCGLCATRWRFRRVGCPHCGNESPQKLQVLEIEGERGLRLDSCRECNGFVKTDTGLGREELMLADWPTLHLDALAAGCGLQRHGPSLFEA